MREMNLKSVDVQQSDLISTQVIFIDYLAKIAKKRDYTEESIEKLITLFEQFIVRVLEIRNITYGIIVLLQESLIKVMKNAISSKLPPEKFCEICERARIVDTLTFLLDQIKENRLNERVIKDYLELISNTKYFNRNVMYLYRVNRKFIYNNYSINLNQMSIMDLYYGITSGYLEYRENNSESYKYLMYLLEEAIEKGDKDNALFVLKKMHKEGYVNTIPESLENQLF